MLIGGGRAKRVPVLLADLLYDKYAVSGATHRCSVCRATSQKTIPFGGPRQTADSVWPLFASTSGGLNVETIHAKTMQCSVPHLHLSRWLQLCRWQARFARHYRQNPEAVSRWDLWSVLLLACAPEPSKNSSNIGRCFRMFPTAPDTVSACIRRGCIWACAFLCALSTFAHLTSVMCRRIYLCIMPGGFPNSYRAPRLP